MSVAHKFERRARRVVTVEQPAKVAHGGAQSGKLFGCEESRVFCRQTAMGLRRWQEATFSENLEGISPEISAYVPLCGARFALLSGVGLKAILHRAHQFFRVERS